MSLEGLLCQTFLALKDVDRPLAVMASKTNTMDWEEARAEFFQETYPSESLNSNASTEVRRPQGLPSGVNSASFRDASVGTLESRSSRISIHLNRTASTTPADAVSPTAESKEEAPPSVPAHQPPSSISGTNRTNKARMRAAVQGLEEEESEGEIEVVDFTDENLATEVESWQNQKRLRDLAVPLAQKKRLRLQYEKCPKIKLTRMRALKFAIKRFGHQLCSWRASLCHFLMQWSKPLACVDRHRGGEMFTALQLHKILFFIVFIIGLTVLSFLLLPFLLFMCDFSLEQCTQWNISSSSSSLEGGGNSSFTISTPWWPFQRGFSSYFLYSFFSPISLAQVEDDSTTIHLFEGHFPAVYLAVVILCQLGVSVYLFRQMVVLIKSVTWDETADTWFKSIYSSWNHNMVCQTSSTLKHRSIYRQVKQKIQLSRSPTKAKTFCTRCLVVAARCLSFFFTLVIWACIVSVVHLATLLQNRPIDELFATFSNIEPPVGVWRQVLDNLLLVLPVILVVSVRLVILPLASLLDKWEYFPFNTRVIAYSCRLFVSRAVALFTLVTTIFHLHEGNCWEDHLCQQLLALVVIDASVDVLLVIVFRFPRVLLSSLFQRRWSCSTKLDYDPYETIVDLATDLGTTLLGLLYCPVLPLFMGVKLILGYGLRLFHVWVNCSASRNTHSPSCIRFLFVGFSSVMLLFSNVVFVYAILCNPVSETCGAFRDHVNLIDVFTESWHKVVGDHVPLGGSAPAHFLHRGLSPAAMAACILAALIAVLLFGLYISHLKRLSIERDANELKCQLAIATQEKCYLIAKIKRPTPKTATT